MQNSFFIVRRGGEILLTINELQELSKGTLIKNPSNDLKELTDIHIDTNLPIEKRVEAFFSQIINPYIFTVCGTKVTVGFGNHNTTLNDCISKYLVEKKNCDNTIL